VQSPAAVVVVVAVDLPTGCTPRARGRDLHGPV